MLGGEVECVGTQLAPVPSQLILILVGVPRETLSLKNTNTQLKYSLY